MICLEEHLAPIGRHGCPNGLHSPASICRMVDQWLRMAENESLGIDRALSRQIVGRLREEIYRPGPESVAGPVFIGP